MNVKTIRLIELFAGYGSQAMALKRLGLPFEHHFVCEFDKYAIKSYNAVHGTDFPTIDIRDVHAADLSITDRDNFTYLLTYSFPCTDLSIAGKLKGMRRESGTRSGLLWEVERILKECGDNLPQILMMENVTQVHGGRNVKDFAEWISFLDTLGYKSKWQDLNAKDYGVAQNRNRCFMISWLDKSKTFCFPQAKPLYKTMNDYLNEKVEEKYYLKSEKVQKLIDELVISGTLEKEREKAQALLSESQKTAINYNEKCVESVNVNLDRFDRFLNEAIPICARDYKGFGCGHYAQNGVLESQKVIRSDCPETIKIRANNSHGYYELVGGGILDASYPTSKKRRGRVQDNGKTCPTIATSGELMRVETKYRIRRLTELECLRLMGVEEDDIKKIKAAVSPTQCYKQAGNSIVVDVMVAIFDNLFNEKVEQDQMSIYDYL